MKQLTDLLFKSWKSTLVGLLLLAASSLLTYVKLHLGEKLNGEYFIHLLTYVGMAVWFLLKTDVSQMVEVYMTDQTGLKVLSVEPTPYASEFVNTTYNNAFAGKLSTAAPELPKKEPEPEAVPVPVSIPEPVPVVEPEPAVELEPVVVPEAAAVFIPEVVPAAVPPVQISLSQEQAGVLSDILAKFGPRA